MLSSQTPPESVPNDAEIPVHLAVPLSADRWTLSQVFRRLEDLEDLEEHLETAPRSTPAPGCAQTVF